MAEQDSGMNTRNTQRTSPKGQQAGRVLIVDDKAYWRDILDEHVREEGFYSTQVDEYMQARSLLQTQPFDIVLLDWELTLPNQGLWLLQVILDLHKTGKGPYVIVVTGSDEGGQAGDAAFEHLDVVIGFLSKDKFEPWKLQKALRKAWKRCREKENRSELELDARIFLGYVQADEARVKALRDKLSDAGLKPWMGEKDLLPGEQRDSIRKIIRDSDFFFACLSTRSITERGSVQKEIRLALETWEEKKPDDIFLIPVLLEECAIPESLGRFHGVKVFEADGWTRLMEAIRVGIERQKR